MPFTIDDIREGQRYPLRAGGHCTVIQISNDIVFPGYTFVEYQKDGSDETELVTIYMFIELIAHPPQGPRR